VASYQVHLIAHGGCFTSTITSVFLVKGRKREESPSLQKYLEMSIGHFPDIAHSTSEYIQWNTA
jgi:hypothetical protein